MKTHGSSTLAVLRRWQEMDALLAGPGLNVPDFASSTKVSTRTIKRDRLAFEELGQEMSWAREYRNRPVVEQYIWRYKPGVDPLFTVNSTEK